MRHVVHEAMPGHIIDEYQNILKTDRPPLNLMFQRAQDVADKINRKARNRGSEAPGRAPNASGQGPSNTQTITAIQKRNNGGASGGGSRPCRHNTPGCMNKWKFHKKFHCTTKSSTEKTSSGSPAAAAGLTTSPVSAKNSSSTATTPKTAEPKEKQNNISVATQSKKIALWRFLQPWSVWTVMFLI